MSTPADRQITDLFTSLRRLADQPTKNGPTVLDHLEQKLLLAAHRNRAGSNRTRDGYPSGSGPGDGGEDAPQSSTEAAALANLHGQHRDPLDDNVAQAIGHLVEAVNHLGALASRLALVDHQSSTSKHSNPPESCRVCDRVVMCTAEDPIRSGYCGACSKAWYRWSATERDEGREPDRGRFERNRKNLTTA